MSDWVFLAGLGLLYLLVTALAAFLHFLPFLIGVSIAKEIWKDDEKEQEP